ncbi:MAG: Mur ligase family protein [Actinomycetota bacterium]|nr:Mur ligase family protein [Actinomycetota bacterium]
MHLSYEAVCEELDRRRRIALGFERIEALLKLLDDPQRSLRVVQVVGTNGKGTTAVALAAALKAAGHACGTYLSPHVLSYTERVMLHGHFVAEEDFAATMGKAIEVADANGVPATQFELLTAGTLALFRDAKLEWAILEAGLGARHDATSAAQPEAVVLTNVGRDHTEYLGDTVEKIAEEKLASLHPGATLVLGTNDPRVVGVARETVKKVGASLVEYREQEERHQAASGVEKSTTPYSLLPTPRSEATYLAHNERLGARAAEVLLGRPLRRDERQTARGLARAARLPARFEVHEVRGVPVIVDGGHNPEGLEAALGAVRAEHAGRPLGVVFGALKDKDVGTMLAALEREAHALVLTRPAGATDGRALDPRSVEKEYGPRDTEGRRARVASDAGEALCLAVEEMERAGGAVLVTGSLYTGAGVLRWMRRGR